MKILLLSLCAIFANIIGHTEEIKTIYEQIPNIGKYEFFLSNSLDENKKTFDTYESKKGGKIITACIPNAYGFYIKAKWDITVKNQDDATRLATEACAENGHGFVLLGYGLGYIRKL